MIEPTQAQSRTIRQQHRASDPQASAWVRANAGSGKTHVLAQRVIRLLLAGVAPSKILCLTFTKAAAANMSMRIFDTLATWTSLNNGKLRAAIAETGAPADTCLDRARRLFVRTIETPGGLKVQTIHAFCERLLHLFPFESNTAARFEPIDDAMRSALLEEARARVLQDCIDQPHGELANALANIAAETGAAGFKKLLQSAIVKREPIQAAAAYQSNGLKTELAMRLGLDPGDDLQTITSTILDDGIAPEALEHAITELEGGSANDIKLADELRTARSIIDISLRAETYLACYFTKTEGTPKSSLGTKKISEDTRNLLRDEQDRLTLIRDRLKGVNTLERTYSITRIATAVFDLYAHLKNVRGLLDFDDMIERTRTLLSRSDANWILYKLDSGIDHVLIDEAQDTSPAQWDILKRLTEEFFAGAGVRDEVRTFFAVGDEKQSIFSFQGAAPHEFGIHRKLFAKKVSDASHKFEDVTLQMSFRSSPTVLASVDATFADIANRTGLTLDDDAPPVHEAWKHQLPGLVEIWPLITPKDSEIPSDWRLPLDTLDEQSPAAAMAQRVANKIAALINPASQQIVHERDGRQRPVRAGDIMVLVRSRSAFFECVIRALKERNVPVAGADRLRICDHIAIMDLVAAGRAALLPEDDLTLAVVLKSPLIGFDDDDLIALAPHRQGSLWAALRQSPSEHHVFATRTIEQWGTWARSGPPFEFYGRLLGPGGARRKLLARLGSEANDAIDEFLRLALETGRQGAPGLTQFLTQLAKSDVEIKRDMEDADDIVRVMTVHAAKGLEAKIVFLPDTCSSPSGGHVKDIIQFPSTDGPEIDKSSLLIWRRSKKEDPENVGAVLENLDQADNEEHRRLLYVALTRAEERLYIGGFHGVREPKDECWYAMIDRSLGDQGAEIASHWADGETVRRIGIETLALPSETDSIYAAPAVRVSARPPDYLFAIPRHEATPPPPVRPSNAQASADQLEPMTEEQAPDGATASPQSAAIGRLVHDLLQYLPSLPPDERLSTGKRYLAARAGFLPLDRRQQLVNQVERVISDPALAPLFASDARVEAAIAGEIFGPGGTPIPITGRIDRLALSGDIVLVADFKTGRPRLVTQTSTAYVRQMALYRAALQPLFPDKKVETIIIWTEGPVIVALPDDMLADALKSFFAAKDD